MSDEIEAAGAMVTAGLVASQVPGTASAGHADEPHAQGDCRNCSTPLTGAYCHACGQSSHVHRSLLHLAEEILHGVSHFDAKGWRTLPLLIARPGLLTRRYIEGQRTRYVSPLALFLFTVFLTFLVLSFTSKSQDAVVAGAALLGDSRSQLEMNATEAHGKVASARAALEKAKQNGSDATEAADDLAEALKDEQEAEKELRELDALRQGTSASGPGTPASGVTIKGWRDGLRTMKVETGNAGLDESIHHATENPDLALYKLKNSAYKFSFMLVPISLPFLWLMFFWRRGVTLFDHAVFLLYSLSFMSLLFITAVLLSAAHWGAASVVLQALVPIHMFMQLRETYGLSIFSALWRTFVLQIFAAFVLVLFLLFVIAVSMG